MKLDRKLAILEGISRGERALADGKVLTHAEAKKRLAKWLLIQRDDEAT
jgi:predicted transcriptional regulator